MTTAEFSLDTCEGALKKQLAFAGDRLQESARRDSQEKSRSFINGQATCD